MKDITTLNLLKKGSKGKIVKIDNDSEIYDKLNRLNVRIGDHFKVIRITPIGKSMIVFINNFYLCIGEKYCKKISVKIENGKI